MPETPLTPGDSSREAAEDLDEQITDYAEASDGDISVQLPTEPVPEHWSFWQARKAMVWVAIFLGLSALISFGYGVLRCFSVSPAGEPFMETAQGLPDVLGHLLRGVALGILCLRVRSCVYTIDPTTGEPTPVFTRHYRCFWKSAAITLWLLGAYSVLQLGHSFYLASRAANQEQFPEPIRSHSALIPPNRIEFRRADTQPQDGLVKMRGTNHTDYFVAPKPEVTGRDIAHAKVFLTEFADGVKRVEVSIKFTDAGREKMEKLTTDPATVHLAVLIDGQLRSVPRVTSKISSDAMLSDVFTADEALRIIDEINQNP
jgi:hypothetical protein